ncbi:MAG: hypothetical protein M5U12_12030 [Verrucomicrobia bacterium]|nr:hypothetical protein [Verrucomicrobiota bacterium]
MDEFLVTRLQAVAFIWPAVMMLSTWGSAFSTWISSSWSVMSRKNGIMATSPGPEASSAALG